MSERVGYRGRPGPAQALAAVRADDTLVGGKFDRLTRSVSDARHIGRWLTVRRQTHRGRQHQSGERTIADLAELFSGSRATVHRVLERRQSAHAPSRFGGL
ncbi:hypothetical protein ACWDFL_15830 [Streptomyces bungoensis]